MESENQEETKKNLTKTKVRLDIPLDKNTLYLAEPQVPCEGMISLSCMREIKWTKASPYEVPCGCEQKRSQRGDIETRQDVGTESSRHLQG